MLDRLGGLPVHPLFAHAVVVLVPATALCAVLVVLWPAARRRIGGLALLPAAATLVAIPLTTQAGAQLYQHVRGSQVLDRHAGLGSQLVVWFAPLVVAMVLWWALHTPLFADRVASLPQLVRRVAVVAAGTGALLLAVATTWLIVLIGHSGTQAVWGAVSCCS